MGVLGYLRSYLTPLLAAALCLGLLSGCGGDGSQSDANREEISNLEGEFELGGVVTEQEIAVARGHHEAGRLLWQRADLDSYTFEVALETVGVLRVRVVDGDVVSEEATSLNGVPSDFDSGIRPTTTGWDRATMAWGSEPR